MEWQIPYLAGQKDSISQTANQHKLNKALKTIQGICPCPNTLR